MGLTGYLIATFVPIPKSISNMGNYIAIILLVIAGLIFLYGFGYIIYEAIDKPKNIQNILVVGGFSFVTIIMASSSFYLSYKAWKDRHT